MGNCKSRNFSAKAMRRMRDLPPSHSVLKVESYSSFVKRKLERYESAVFEAAGHKWRLVFYPRGKHNNNNYISMYIQMADTTQFFANWELNVQFKLFIHDQIRDKYLVIEDAQVDVRRFYAMKTEWGFKKFLSMSTFKNAANGYLVNDCCVFGAEISIPERTYQEECLSMIKSPAHGTYTWKIQNFSEIKDRYHSDTFNVGNSRWKLTINPKGDNQGKGNSLSFYLHRSDVGGPLSSYPKIYAAYALRLKNHLQTAQHEYKADHWFGPTEGWGYPKFISLGNLTKSSNNYIQGDSIILECQITQISMVENFN